MSLQIKDPVGSYPTVKQMRSEFENAINNTALLKANTPLGAMEINGAFSHYITPDTDTLWIGFALGRRAGHRLNPATPLSLKIRLERNDEIPAFAGFLRCEEQHTDSAVIVMNVEACMSPVSQDDEGGAVPITREERKWLIITSLMHEFGHALEAHFRLPVNEEAIETACMAWEAAPRPAQCPAGGAPFDP